MAKLSMAKCSLNVFTTPIPPHHPIVVHWNELFRRFWISFKITLLSTVLVQVQRIGLEVCMRNFPRRRRRIFVHKKLSPIQAIFNMMIIDTTACFENTYSGYLVLRSELWALTLIRRTFNHIIESSSRYNIIIIIIIK